MRFLPVVSACSAAASCSLERGEVATLEHVSLAGAGSASSSSAHGGLGGRDVGGLGHLLVVLEGDRFADAHALDLAEERIVVGLEMVDAEQAIGVDHAAAIVVALDADEVDAPAADADEHVLAEAVFECGELPAFAVEHLEGDVGADGELDACDVVALEHDGEVAHDVEDGGLGGADLPGAVAGFAVAVDALAERGSHALAGELDEAELADRAEAGAGAVGLEQGAEPLLDLAAVLGGHHVDEVADHDAAHVAEAELACDLVDGFLVGFEGVGLGVAGVAGLAGVDVDGDEGLGLVEDERAARGQGDLAVLDAAELGLDAEAVHERDGVVVEDEPGLRAGVGDLEEVAGAFGGGGVVDDDALDLGGEHVADGADHQVGLGVELAGAFGLLLAFFDELPESEEVGEVALELGLGLADAGGSDDEAHVLGGSELFEDVACGASGVVVLDLSGDAEPLHVRHHDEVSSGDGEVAGEGGSLGADAFLEDLDEDAVAASEALLDGGSFAVRRFGADFFELLAVLAGEVAGVDVGEVEEAAAFEAEVDEGGLDGGFDVGDLAGVDVADVGLVAGALLVELFELAVVGDRDPALFAGHVVDQHLLGHEGVMADCRFRVAIGGNGAGRPGAPPVSNRNRKSSTGNPCWPSASSRRSRRLGRLWGERRAGFVGPGSFGDGPSIDDLGRDVFDLLAEIVEHFAFGIERRGLSGDAAALLDARRCGSPA